MTYKNKETQKWPIRSTSRINKYLSVEQPKEIGYTACTLVSATLPHSKPIDNSFQRRNGNFVLTFTSNSKFGLPYDSIPRMFLVWLTTQLVTSKVRIPEIDLGKSYNSFLKKLGLQNGGGKHGNSTRVRDQLMRLLTCSISNVYHDNQKGYCKSDQFHISRSLELWWNPLQTGHDGVLQNSKIILAKDFFEELITKPVPIYFEALRMLSLRISYPANNSSIKICYWQFKTTGNIHYATALFSLFESQTQFALIIRNVN